MGDDPDAGVTAPHHEVGVRVDVDVVEQFTQGDLGVFLGLVSGSVYFLVNLNVHFLQTHKNSAYCTKSIMNMLCLTFYKYNIALLVLVIQIHINVFLQISFQYHSVYIRNTRDLKGLRVDPLCDKYGLFNYCKWCTLI